MDNLIIFASPHESGNTKKALDVLREQRKLEGEIILAYKENIKPCIDCNYCKENRGCSIHDGMTKIYRKIDNAKRIIIASPIYFFGVPGVLKNIIDRCQTYYLAANRGDNEYIKPKKAFVILTAGAKKFKTQFLGAELTLKSFFNAINVKEERFFNVSGTDEGFNAKEFEKRIKNVK